MSDNIISSKHTLVENNIPNASIMNNHFEQYITFKMIIQWDC